MISHVYERTRPANESASAPAFASGGTTRPTAPGRANLGSRKPPKRSRERPASRRRTSSPSISRRWRAGYVFQAPAGALPAPSFGIAGTPALGLALGVRGVALRPMPGLVDDLVEQALPRANIPSPAPRLHPGSCLQEGLRSVGPCHGNAREACSRRRPNSTAPPTLYILFLDSAGGGGGNTGLSRHGSRCGPAQDEASFRRPVLSTHVRWRLSGRPYWRGQPRKKPTSRMDRREKLFRFAVTKLPEQRCEQRGHRRDRLVPRPPGKPPHQRIHSRSAR